MVEDKPVDRYYCAPDDSEDIESLFERSLLNTTIRQNNRIMDNDSNLYRDRMLKCMFFAMKEPADNDGDLFLDDVDTEFNINTTKPKKTPQEQNPKKIGKDDAFQ
jgi:hypothetical protein